MSAKRHSSLDRVLGRLDTLDTVNLTNLVQRLARERGLFEAIFNTVREGILVVDPDGRIEYANDAAVRLIGVKERDFGGTSLWRLVPGLRQMLEATGARSGEARPVAARELELAYPERRVVRVYVVPFSGGGPMEEDHDRLAVILADITREVHSTRERIESEKVNSILLLAAGVAHELGNPLNSLTIQLQLLERKLRQRRRSDVESLTDSVQICQAEVARLDGIIKHFLEAIRPRPPDLAETRLADVLEEVLRFETNQLSDRGIRVEVDVEDNPPVILADRNQLKQVFFNVIKNAMEAMGKGGRLKVRLRSDDDYVYLQLGDSGSGIRQEDIPRLFEPYFTTKTSGHGLGLMIVNRIMRDHGGRIGIDSQEGVGTVVTLTFPQKTRRVRMLREREHD